jgi:hypothetical protein
MAGSTATLIAQSLWWAAGISDERLGFYAPGPWTIGRQRRHRSLDRLFHLGLLTGGFTFTNIIKLHAFWLNERLRSFRVSIDPDPTTVDIFWVYSQDPLPPQRRSRIADSIRRARSGTPVINPPEVFDAYHRPDIFHTLAEAGASVPRTRFGPKDVGTPVVFKPEGTQSTVIGPVPWDGPRPGMRPFEFIDSRGEDGLYRRYRAVYLLGRCFAGTCQASSEAIVRAQNRPGDYVWRLTDAEVTSLEKAAAVTGLDFFTADFLRVPDGSRSVLTDINSFPMLKERDLRPEFYGHQHDFSLVRPARGDGIGAWDWLEHALHMRVARAAGLRTEKPS